MPNIKSAEKRVRQIKTRTLRNRALKSRLKTFRKNVQTAVEDGSKEDAESKLRLFFKSVDKAAKQNVIHKNAAARYKSAMSKLVAAKS